MSSINEEYTKFHSPSYDNENDSLNTYFSNENYYPFIYGYPYINVSENYYNYFIYPNNSNSFITRDMGNFENMEEPILPIGKTNKSQKFSVSLKGDRGPKPKNGYLEMKRRRHLNTHLDNLQIKIQVNYINFIINLSNDILFSIFKNNKKYNLKYIDHAFKIDVSQRNFDFLKSSKIKDVLGKEISDKYKTFTKNINKELLDEVCQKSAWLNCFFNLNYLDLFKCYYNDQKQIDTISFYEQIITLSEKTQKKTFYELLIKNKNIKKELINAVKNAYFNGKDPNNPIMDENRIESKWKEAIKNILILVVLNLFIVNNILLIFYYILLFNLNYFNTKQKINFLLFF